MSCFSGLLTENETWNWLYNGDQLKSTSKCDSRTPRTKKTTKCSHNHQLINVYKYLYNETCEENFFKKNADFNLSFFSLSLQTTTWNHIFKESAGNNDDRNGLSEEVLFFFLRRVETTTSHGQTRRRIGQATKKIHRLCRTILSSCRVWSSFHVM